MCNRLLITMAVLSSFTLVGCGSLLYSDTLAPVYSKGNANSTSFPPPLTNPTATEVDSIENPNSQPSVVVNSSQNDPYGDSSMPQRPAGMHDASNNDTSVVGADASLSAQSEVNSEADFSDPRIREASDVLGENGGIDNDNNTVEGAPPLVDRPASTIRQQRDEVETSVDTETRQVTENVGVKEEQNKADTRKSEEVASAQRPVRQQSAIKTLLEEAKGAVTAGDYDKAASVLERAHRIEPGNAKILYDIAQIRYAQGKYRQAESFASKAANYSSSPALSKKVWMLLSNARKSLGNSTGAESAARKAANF